MYNVAALVISKWIQPQIRTMQREIEDTETRTFLDIIRNENVTIQMEKEWKKNVSSYWGDILGIQPEDTLNTFLGQEYNMDELDTKGLINYVDDGECKEEEKGHDNVIKEDERCTNMATPDGEISPLENDSKSEENDLNDMLQMYEESKPNDDRKYDKEPERLNYDTTRLENKDIMIEMFHQWINDPYCLVQLSSFANEHAKKCYLNDDTKDIKAAKGLQDTKPPKRKDGPTLTVNDKKIFNNFNN